MGGNYGKRVKISYDSIVSVDALPMVNDKRRVIVLGDSDEWLIDEWMAYNERLLELGEKRVPGYKAYYGVFNPRIHAIPAPLSQGFEAMFGLGNDFHFLRHNTEAEGPEDPPLLLRRNFDYLHFLMTSDNGLEYVNKVPLRTIIDKFFVFLWGRGRILNPVTPYVTGGSHYATIWELVDDIPLVRDLRTMMEEEKYFSYHRKGGWDVALIRVFSMTQWEEPDDIVEEDLLRLMDAFTKMRKEKYQEGLARNLLSVLELIRYYLIEKGRKDISDPKVALAEYRSSKSSKSKPIESRVGEILDMNCVWADAIAEKAREHILLLHKQGLAMNSIERRMRAYRRFVYAIGSAIPYKPKEEFDPNVVEEKLSSIYSIRMWKVLEDQNKSEAGYYSDLDYIKTLIEYTGYFTSNFITHIPQRPRKKMKRKAYRQAMPREMVQHIVEILKERPPISPVRWDRGRADLSWWPHEVYPVFPLMMLFGYYIPLRGSQVRWICREKSFVLSRDKKTIETIVINTDKNTRRDYFQEIPNVWEDLNIFIPFIAWHKAYFPLIKPVPYKLDDRSPWEDVLPLMITPQSPYPIPHATHMAYHKRVLCQYQIEKNLEAERTGERAPVVAWREDGEPFFSSIEELNKTSREAMKKIKIAYDIHSLRVTGATRYLDSGLGINTVMGLTGHTRPETLLQIYIQLTREEKESALRSAVDQIYFGEKENMLEHTHDLIRGELTRAYHDGEKGMVRALEDNKLFSLYRKPWDDGDYRDLYPGNEIATQIHPSRWQPMIYGICPGVACPDGRENHCSLCPHLITGKLFLEGITHQINLLFTRFQRLSIEMDKERKEKKYFHAGKSEELELILEEIMGWQEILMRIDDTVEEELAQEREASEGKEMVVSGEGRRSAVGLKQTSTELAYLKNAYSAQQFGVEQDYYGLKVLTIHAVKIALKMGESEEAQAMIEDETKAIDMLMGFYQKQVGDTQDVDYFLKEVHKLEHLKRNI